MAGEREIIQKCYKKIAYRWQEIKVEQKEIVEEEEAGNHRAETKEA